MVAASPINRIVIARTLEKIYLRSDAVTPPEALAALRASKPIVAIIDDNGAEGVLDALLNELASRRQSSNHRVPRIVLIGRAGPTAQASGHAIDAMVPRPFTPDTLHPIVERVLAGIRAG